MAMDFVGDYRTAREEAERRRRRLERLLGRDYDTGAIVTPGNDNYPGQVQANWAGNIAKLAGAFSERSAEESAEEAEDAATEARRAALENLMSGGASQPQTPPGYAYDSGTAARTGGFVSPSPPSQSTPLGAGGTITPAQLDTLTELGIDTAALKYLLPKKPELGAITQGSTNRASIEAMVANGSITREMGDQILRGLGEQEKIDQENYLFEQRNKAFNPRLPNESDAEYKVRLYREDPETFARVFGDKTKTGGGRGSGRYDPAREAEVLGNTATALEALINKEGDEMFGAMQTGAATAREFGSKAGGVLGTVAEMAGTKVESPANAQMRAMGVDAALEAIAKMAPASDTDVQLLLRNKPNAFQNKESALAFVALMKKVAERYKNYVNPDVTIDSDIDSLMSTP